MADSPRPIFESNAGGDRLTPFNAAALMPRTRRTRLAVTVRSGVPEALPTMPSDPPRSVTELLDAEGHTLQPPALVHEVFARRPSHLGAGARRRPRAFAAASGQGR